MKKLLYCAAALATLLFAGSCQKENLEPVENGQTISYTVQLPDVINTKALGDDITNVDDLYYEVWRTSAEGTTVFTDADNRLYHQSVEDAFDDDGIATIEFQLINNQNFTVLFWADVPDNGIYTVTDLTNVTVAQNGDANQEKYAAFSGYDFIKSDEKLTGRTVELKRAVAQLNIATIPASLTQFDDDITLNQSTVTVNGLSTSFNVATQEAGDISTADYVYALQNVPSGNVTVGTDNYTYIAMNYVGFAKKTGSTIDVEYEFTTSEGTISNEIPNVPVKANYRTNIIGNLISSSSSYTVTLDDDWGDDNSTSGNIEVINGGIVKNQNGDYEITNEEGFAYAVNKLFANGGTFYILNNLDMGGYTLGTVTLPNGMTLNLIGEKPVVTRASSTGSTTGITITGLTQPLIAKVEQDATASFSNIVVEDYASENSSAALVGENDGKVVVSGCEATDASNGEVDLVGDSNNNGNVVDASDAANGGGLAYLQYMLGTNVSTITLSSPVVILANQTVELDLEGKTVTYTTTDQEDHMFTNNGNLTLNGNGSIEYIYAGANDSNYGKGNYAIINKGTLAINGPTVSVSVNGLGENVKFSHALYAVHNSGVMTLDNGKIINDNNIAIRQWIGSEVNPSTITINGGEVYGLRAIWMQLPSNDSSKAPNGNLNVNGGTLSAWENAAEYDSSNKLAIYSYSYGNAMKNVNINISGGTFNGDIALTGGRSDAKVDTESLTITGGTFNGLWGDVYSYANDAEAAKTIMITGGEFSSIYPLVYLNSENEVIKLNEDVIVETEEHTYMTFKGVGTLDLNGKTVTSISNAIGGNYNFIDVKKGNLTVKNGTVTTYHNGTNMAWNNSTNVFDVTDGGVLNIENATIKNLGGSDMAFVAHLNNWGEVTLNVENSILESSYIPVRVFNSGNDMNNVTINNSTLMGTSRAFWVHNYTDVDFGTVEKAEQHRELLNFDIFNGTNKFEASNPDRIIEYGFTNPFNFDAEGNYVFRNATVFQWFANEVNLKKNSFEGKTVKLGNNIDLDGIDWTPIGQTGATTFNGVFDGQNYTILNLKVNSEAQTGKNYSSGLFGWVESHTAGHGHIKNVKINGAEISGHHNCGALVGYITQETALVENCHVTGATISCTHANGDADGDKAGALIGNATVATPVKDCTAANSTVSAGRDAGQVIGAGKQANVTGCSATKVTVTANGTGTGANVRNEVIGRLL